VRPTDENQHSTRPNLMSSPRRGGSEESILAMLERDSPRGIGPRLSRSTRAVWFGVGGVLAVGLVGMVVWLVRGDPADQQAQELALASAGMVAHGQPVSAGAAAAPSENAARLSNGAAIVEEKLPTLGKGSPQPAAPASAATPTATSGQAGAAAGAVIEDAVTEPALPAVRSASSAPAAKLAQAVAAPGAQTHKAAAPTEPKRAAKVVRSESAREHGAAKPNQVATTRNGQRGTLHPAVKPRKAHALPAAEPKVDSDVALISAVIQHASKQHAQTQPERPCDDDNDCAAKTTPQP
jgi:hypothetical protein